MISESVLLFPTLITVGKREVDELEKESWFSAYLEMSDEDGKSMDYLGYQSIHHDHSFHYSEIIYQFSFTWCPVIFKLSC